MNKLFVLLTLIISSIFATAHAAYQDDFDGLLKDYVKPVSADGIDYNGVDYNAWAKDPRHAQVRDAVLAIDPKGFTTKDEKLAYWINTYNILTIDLITRTGEQKSIKDLGSTFSSPWKKYKWNIAGKEYNLNHIEHGIIRKMGEPRIHFAVNCAAKSCPDLREEAYRADKLDAQLNEQANITLDNETKGFRKENGTVVHVTKIMDWYGKDFDEGDLVKWLATYKPDDVTANTKVKFFSYDWSLNKQ